MLASNVDNFAIRGNYVCFMGERAVCKKGTIVVKDGNIAGILPYDHKTGLLEIDLKENEVIFPGLADLHSHHEYNMLPIWKRPKSVPKAWDNRHEWRKCDAYIDAIKKPMDNLNKNWNKTINEHGLTAGDLLLYFAEIQAVAGGTTVLQEPTKINVPDNEAANGSNDFYEEYEPVFRYNYFAEKTDLYGDCEQDGAYIKTPHMLLRGTQSPKELGIQASENAVINSVVDLFKPEVDHINVQPHIDTSDWKVKSIDVNNLKEYLSSITRGEKNYLGYIVHLAEGRAGVLKPDGLGCDGYSAKEVPLLIDTLKGFIDSGDISSSSVKALHINLIHACGADLSKNETIRFLADNGIGIIWSPVSNLLLYEDTPDFYDKLKGSGIVLGLGSDWSPSGSKHVWDECKFAYKYLKHRYPNDSYIGNNVLKMVTVNAAKLVGSEKIGNIKTGNFADLFVIKGNNKIDGNIDNALDAFYSSEDDGVQMVVIGGNLIYGDFSYFYKLRKNYALIPTKKRSVSLQSKAIYMPPSWNVELAKDLESLRASLGKTPISEFRSSEDEEYKAVISELERKFAGM